MARTKKHKLTGAKSISKRCRNNGTCPHCKSTRLYKNLKRSSEAIF